MNEAIQKIFRALCLKLLKIACTNILTTAFPYATIVNAYGEGRDVNTGTLVD